MLALQGKSFEGGTENIVSFTVEAAVHLMSVYLHFSLHATKLIPPTQEPLNLLYVCLCVCVWFLFCVFASQQRFG